MCDCINEREYIHVQQTHPWCIKVINTYVKHIFDFICILRPGQLVHFVQIQLICNSKCNTHNRTYFRIAESMLGNHRLQVSESLTTIWQWSRNVKLPCRFRAEAVLTTETCTSWSYFVWIVQCSHSAFCVIIISVCIMSVPPS